MYFVEGEKIFESLKGEIKKFAFISMLPVQLERKDSEYQQISFNQICSGPRLVWSAVVVRFLGRLDFSFKHS